MKVLIVCSGNTPIENDVFDFKTNQPFVYEQIESMSESGVEYDTFFITEKGSTGYIKNYVPLLRKIKAYKPDLVHAHYGFSGLLASIQRKVPVVITFHGSDINEKKNRFYSYVSSRLSIENIFVHRNHPSKINYKGRLYIIPCGVDTDIFFPIDKHKARKLLSFEDSKRLVLFSSRFDNRVKNYKLAYSSVKKVKGKTELIELKNYSRKDVNLLLNAVDLLLFTSFSEGSPQLIKEAMACNCPIISVDVGDVKNVVGETEGCFITSYDPSEIASSIEKVLSWNKRTNGRKNIKLYSLDEIALKVLDVYNEVLKR